MYGWRYRAKEMEQVRFVLPFYMLFCFCVTHLELYIYIYIKQLCLNPRNSKCLLQMNVRVSSAIYSDPELSIRKEATLHFIEYRVVGKYCM